MLPDSSSITELFQRYAPAVFTYLQKHIKYREDAEDVLLDIFTIRKSTLSVRQLACTDSVDFRIRFQKKVA
ncbi:hypothetical protein KSX_77030 [Ktedonospora formicarum]|uniref:RNA polymerase sigma-70 region 2 domain-containing protein n=1 Tax=Ktedonospora formicarum TaxID=2778364 RepID=A0A8J3MVP1_9CHLR|nr:hypothetical protein KSX_77030 [Ktedonospora formicarum]